MASQPMTSTDHQSSLSISHQQQPPQHQPQSRPSSLSLEIHNEHQRSVGTQAKIGAPVKIISPRPWKSHIHQDTGAAAAAATGNMSSGVSTSTSRLVNMITYFLCIFSSRSSFGSRIEFSRENASSQIRRFFNLRKTRENTSCDFTNFSTVKFLM